MDGELRPWDEVTVHVLSQSLSRGSLVFDVMAVSEIGGQPMIFGLREHTERFLRSASANAMDLAFDLDALLAAIGRAVRANPGCQLVKISAYNPGVSLDVLPTDDRPSVAIAAFSMADVHPAAGSGRRPSAKLQIARSLKMPASVISPQTKIAAGYTHAATAVHAARAEGYHDVLFLDERGDLAESSTQSFFLVCEGLLRTAPLDVVLAGITRSAVIDLALDAGLDVKVEPLPFDLLDRADEAFLAGTSNDVWPVGRIDQRELPSPVPGRVTALLVEGFARMLRGEDPVLSERWMQKV